MCRSVLVLVCFIYQKHKKISYFYFRVVIFLFCFNFAKMSTPEIEVRSFKQQGGESLKDAWYRISDAHRRCTKKYSTMILLRNFYVGITSWYRYVLDTLTGGNFLGTPALEARNIIESLVGTPPINDLKIETTLEDVIKKLESMEKNLPDLLGSSSKVNESLGDLNKRIAILEASTGHENQNFRIGELEDTLSSTLSSIKFKKKAFVGKAQKIMYVRKVPQPKNPNVLKTDKIEGESHNELFKFASQELPEPKMPIVTSCVFEEVFDGIDASSLGNT